METRKMIRNQLLNSSSLNNSVTLDQLNFDLNQLFDKVKALLTNESFNKSESSDQEINVKNIMMFLQKKMNKKNLDNPKQFIGMLVIFMYVVRFRKTYFFTFKFYGTFYQNINFCLKNVYKQWKQSKQESRQFITLVTLLFTISNMCQIAEINTRKKNLLKKILNPLFMQIFLQLQLPDNQIILKPYQTLLLKIMKRRQYLPNKNLLLISASKHFLKSNTNQNAKKICLYVLNTSYKLDKSDIVLDEYTVNTMIQQLKQDIIKPQKKHLFNMSLLLAAKLLKKKDQQSIDSFLSVQTLFQLVLQQKPYQFNLVDTHGIISFIKIFDQKKLIGFLKKMINFVGESSIARQIIHQVLSFIMPNITIQLFQHNLLGKLGQNIQSTEESVVILSLCTFKKILEKLDNFDYYFRKIVIQKIKGYLKLISSSNNNRNFQIKLTILYQMIQEAEQFDQQKYII